MKTRLSLVSVSIPFAGVVMSAAVALAVDQVVTDPGDTGSPGQLRAKLTQLQSTGGGILTFQIGTATILLQSPGVLPTITVPCTIDGGGTITISGANQFRIFNLNFSSAGTVTLKNLTLTKAFVFGDGGAIGNATALGTLVTANSSFTADNSQFYNNSAFFGGALYAASGGSLTITNSDLHDNTVGIFDGTQGGGAIYNLGTLIIDAVQLHDNHADGLGGAIDNAFTGSMQVRNSVLRHNSASGGGAIGTSGNGSVSTPTLFDNH